MKYFNAVLIYALTFSSQNAFADKQTQDTYECSYNDGADKVYEIITIDYDQSSSGYRFSANLHGLEDTTSMPCQQRNPLICRLKFQVNPGFILHEFKANSNGDVTYQFLQNSNLSFNLFYTCKKIPNFK